MIFEPTFLKSVQNLINHLIINKFISCLLVKHSHYNQIIFLNSFFNNCSLTKISADKLKIAIIKKGVETNNCQQISFRNHFSKTNKINSSC